MATQLTKTTREVLDHHLKTLGAGDLDGLVSDYTDDSIIIGPDGVVRGRKAIRQMFEFFLSGLLKPGTYDFGVDKLHVDGEIVFIMWHADCQEANIPFAADTFVIKRGKILVQTFAPKIEPHS